MHQGMLNLCPIVFNTDAGTPRERGAQEKRFHMQQKNLQLINYCSRRGN